MSTLRQTTFTIMANRAVLKNYTATAGTSEDVLRGLFQCLADAYCFTALAQNAHWNVDGTHSFSSLHKLFNRLYDESFERVDLFAERLRQLGSYAPADLTVFKTMADFGPALIAPLNVNEWISALLAAQAKVRANLMALQKASAAADDLQTQDMTIKALQEIDKDGWMLKASLGD